LSECKCPAKDKQPFQAKIGEYCAAVAEGGDCSKREATHRDGSSSCPKDDTISQTCLDKILPPYPICLSRTAAEWVDHAKDSATRCCGNDLSQCKCPVKDTQPFQAKIGDYCKAVTEDCSKQEATLGNLRGGFDMEEQIQREEFTP